MRLLTLSIDEGRYYYWLHGMGLRETKIIMLNSLYESDGHRGFLDVRGPASSFHVPYIWPSKYWKLENE